MQEQSQKIPDIETLLNMTLEEWVNDHTKRHGLPNNKRQAFISRVRETFSRKIPLSVEQKLIMHPELYVWLRDESIKRFGKRIGDSINGPIEGVARVRDLRDLYILAPTRNPLDRPWLWLFHNATGKRPRESIGIIEQALVADHLLR